MEKEKRKKKRKKKKEKEKEIEKDKDKDKDKEKEKDIPACVDGEYKPSVRHRYRLASSMVVDSEVREYDSPKSIMKN